MQTADLSTSQIRAQSATRAERILMRAATCFIVLPPRMTSVHKLYRELAPKVKRSNSVDAQVVLEDSAPRTTLFYYKT